MLRPALWIVTPGESSRSIRDRVRKLKPDRAALRHSAVRSVQPALLVMYPGTGYAWFGLLQDEKTIALRCKDAFGKRKHPRLYPL